MATTEVRVIYTPEGGSRRTWVIDASNPPWDVTFNTEKLTGWPWPEFANKLDAASVIALRALLYTLRKRDEPRLDLESVTVQYSEVQLELEEDDEASEAPEDPKES